MTDGTAIVKVVVDTGIRILVSDNGTDILVAAVGEGTTEQAVFNDGLVSNRLNLGVATCDATPLLTILIAELGLAHTSGDGATVEAGNAAKDG